MSKARHCILFSSAALKYFQEHPPYPEDPRKNGVIESKILQSLCFLRKRAAENKRGAKHEAAVARSGNRRIEAGRIITEKDFDLFRKRARESLGNIVESYNSMAAEKEPRDYTERLAILELLFRDQRILSKWSINFLAMLLMYGNGQRTQVYTFLKVPEDGYITEFKQLSRKERKCTPFTIDIDEEEKTNRDLILGSVLFNSVVWRFVEFHVQLVLPYLYKKFEIRVGDSRRRTLLLHTVNGKKLTGYSIRRSLRRFCQSVDHELHVTPTVLRASYASYMVKEYVRGACNGEYAWGKEPDNFIAMLAKVMNTSVEMITDVYADATKMEYSQCVGKLLGIVEGDENVEE